MAAEVSSALGKMVANFPEVVEAHLPYCFIQGLMDEPSQIMVIVLASAADFQTIAGPMTRRLSGITPSEKPILILPLTCSSPVVESVRRVGCEVFRRGDK
jgi:hypothetical protein